MLLGAISVLVVVASGDPADGSTQAMEQALRGALDREVQLSVRSASEATSDASLVSTAKNEHATLLVVISWSDRQRRATLRVVKPAEGRWTDREIRFDAADVPTERGRTVGFALVSMVPEEALPPADRSPPPALPVPPVVPPPLAPPPAAAEAPAAPLPSQNPLALEASALAATAVGGYGGGVGGVFAIRIPLAGAFAARAAIGARGGEVAPAQATSRVIVGAAGIAWQPWLDQRRRFALGARLDALVIHHDLGHLSQDDPDVAHLSRFLPGLDAAVEGTYRFADRAGLVAAVGTEIALGTTEVVVRERQAASLTPVRIVGELGLRVSF
jgi:hypothetical protein